jgi:hypothetical protein
MDIQGLVNHNDFDEKRHGSLTPADNSSSESARSQFPGNAARPYPSQYRHTNLEREEIYSPLHQFHNHIDSITTPPHKRHFDSSSASLPYPNAKRRLADGSGHHHGKQLPTRRRALQACEACRTKKSKCDNERPSCGSCLQHGVECIYKNAPFVPVYTPCLLAYNRLDAASMVLLEKLNKIEATILEQGATIGRIQDATSTLEPNFVSPTKVLNQSRFSPTQPQPVANVVFQVPKGNCASLDYFMALPFVQTFIPSGRKFESLICDNPDVRRENQLPNLQKAHVQKLIQNFLTSVHPLHPVIEITTLERIKQELDEDGLSWSGETALILHILAIGCILAGDDPTEYNSAAKRRMGFAVEKINVTAIQVHYLQG